MTDILPNSRLVLLVDGRKPGIIVELPGVLVDPIEHRINKLWLEMADDLVSSMPTGEEDLFGDHPNWEEYKELSGWT